MDQELRTKNKKIRKKLSSKSLVLSPKLLGFTLIELIVTTTIIIILTTIGISSYNNMNETQTLRDAASDLKNNLRMTQNKVAAGEKICGSGVNACGGANETCGDEDAEIPLSGWRIEFNVNSYRIYGICGSNEFNSKTYSVLGNPKVTISYPLATETLTFKAFPTTVVNAGNICLSGFNKYYKITVSKSGEINDNGIVSSCP